MQKFSQRMALVTGGLCLGVSLLLVCVGHLSSRYILDQQRDQHAQALMAQLARELSPVVAQNDLIRLEGTLRALRERHGLQMIAVTDLDQRPLGHAGDALTEDSMSYSDSLIIDDDIAGELTMAYGDNPARLEQQRMSFGLLFLAILSSLFAGALAGRWGQSAGRRLEALRQRLAPGEPAGSDELTGLESAVESLPLDLIVPLGQAEPGGVDFEEAGLLFVRLESLTRYVETLDEHSLVNYTDSLRHLLDKVAGLYGGQLSVSREFGILLLFSDGHPAGSPGFRAVSCAWLLKSLSEALGKGRSLKFRLGLACGLGEAGRSQGASLAGASLYTDLYNQHIIDDLALLAEQSGEKILLNQSLAEDVDVRGRCKLDESIGAWQWKAFEEPHSDRLERQLHLLLRELPAGQSAGLGKS